MMKFTKLHEVLTKMFLHDKLKQKLMCYLKAYQHEKEGPWYEDVSGTTQSLLLFFLLPQSFCAIELIKQRDKTTVNNKIHIRHVDDTT